VWWAATVEREHQSCPVEGRGGYAIGQGDMSAAGEKYTATLVGADFRSRRVLLTATADARPRFRHADPDLTYQLPTGAVVAATCMRGASVVIQVRDVGGGGARHRPGAH